MDSKYPDIFISWRRIKQAETSLTKQIGGGGVNNPKLDDFRFTPPIEIDDFSGSIPSKSIIFRRDLVGEYFVKGEMYDQI